MFKLLIDTCVWLDLAGEPEQQPLLSVLGELIKLEEVAVLLPRIVIDEFERNRQAIIDNSRRSMSSHFKRVKDAVKKFGDTNSKTKILEQLNDLNARLPTFGEAVAASLSEIDKLFALCQVIEVTDGAKVRAADRALQKRAPFHKSKNSMADSLLIEIYADCVKSKESTGNRFAFVTKNVEDFSNRGANDKEPHPDIAEHFSKRKSLYFTTLGEAMQRIRPDLVSEILMELEEWEPPIKPISELLKVEGEFMEQVWFQRHLRRVQLIEEGKLKVLDEKTYDKLGDHVNFIRRDIWDGAQKAAKAVIDKYGAKSLYFETDFDWGMLNGKLSAMRWVLGDEWDNLDT